MVLFIYKYTSATRHKEVINIFRLFFENEHGKINLNGPHIKCIRIEGLNVPQKEFEFVGYFGESGQTTLSEKDMPRTITISADLTGNKNALAKVNKILYYEGYLILTFDQKVRKIKCRCTSFSDPERHGKDIKNMVLQFICDKPEFTDFENTIIHIFRRKNEITKTFTLPCVFTSRTTEAGVYNSGDLTAEPIFYITAQDSGANLSICNDTTEQHITLNYSISAGETIIIDIDKRSIKNTDGQNLINYISDDTFLNEFWLETGQNHLRVHKGEGESDIAVICEFTNKYIEAVY